MNYSNRATVEVTEEGTNIINTASSNAYYFVKNSAFIFEDYECTFDIVRMGYNYSTVRWYIQNSSNSNQNVFVLRSYVTQQCSMRITYKDGEVKVYVDDVLKTPNPLNITITGPYEMGFRFNNNMVTGTNFVFKNFKVYPL